MSSKFHAPRKYVSFTDLAKGKCAECMQVKFSSKTKQYIHKFLELGQCRNLLFAEKLKFSRKNNENSLHGGEPLHITTFVVWIERINEDEFVT